MHSLQRTDTSLAFTGHIYKFIIRNTNSRIAAKLITLRVDRHSNSVKVLGLDEMFVIFNIM